MGKSFGAVHSVNGMEMAMEAAKEAFDELWIRLDLHMRISADCMAE